MARFDIHLHDARDTSVPPVVVPFDFWWLCIRAARAHGGQDHEVVFSPFDAKAWAAALRRAMSAPPPSAPVHVRPHVPDWMLPQTYAEKLKQESGLVAQVIALAESGNGFTVNRVTAAEHRALVR